MRWEDEKYVRLYTRDTIDWLSLSLEAQGLLALILRKVDRAGLLPLGRHGQRGVSAAIGHAHRWATIEPAMQELILDGCVAIRDNHLIIPNFIEAQESDSSQNQRKRMERERSRDKKMAGEKGLLIDQKCHTMDVTPDVTPSGHAGDVTPSFLPSVPSVPSVPSDHDAPTIIDFELSATPAQKERAKSPQETLYETLSKGRSEMLGSDALPDEEWSAQRINKKLKPLLEANREAVLDAFELYCRDEYALGRDPPCPLGLFVSQWSRWVSASLKSKGGVA